MRTRRADGGDWPAVRELLVDSGLPVEGAEEAFATGVIVRDRDRLVGCAAIEPFGGSALLRSVAVVSDRRGTGVGTDLVRASEALARDHGARELILLTETADLWFGRLGYAVIERSTVPAGVAGSVEFEAACSTSAVAMRRTLV